MATTDELLKQLLVAVQSLEKTAAVLQKNKDEEKSEKMEHLTGKKGIVGSFFLFFI